MRGHGGSTMNRSSRWLTTGLVAASVALAGCGSPAQSAPEHPSRIVPVQGTSVSSVILTPQAVRRIGLQTTPVQQLQAPGATPGISNVPSADDCARGAVKYASAVRGIALSCAVATGWPD